MAVEPADVAVEIRSNSGGLARFAGPKYWTTWICWLWMRASAALPLRVSIAVHRRLWALFHCLPTRSRRIVRCNLEFCFPQLTDRQRRQLSREHFSELGAGMAECAAAWFMPDRRLEGRFEIEGLEHVQAAVESGRGVILCTGHFTPMELCVRPLHRYIPQFTAMFTSRSNGLVNEIMRRGRVGHTGDAIPSDQVRSLLAQLRKNAVIWYAPDLRARSESARLVPFFGEPALTNIATSRIARISGAAIVPYYCARIDNSPKYRLSFEPALKDFPSVDVMADTERLVAILERHIRQFPAQYFWKQKKFKCRPGLHDPYDTRPQTGML